MDCFKCELGVWPLYKSGMEFMDGISFGLLHLTCICLQCLIRIDGDPISSKHILLNILRTLYIYKHRDKPYKNTTCLFVVKLNFFGAKITDGLFYDVPRITWMRAARRGPSFLQKGNPPTRVWNKIKNERWSTLILIRHSIYYLFYTKSANEQV